MYVYIQSEKPCADNNYKPLYTVGHYDPTGTFHPESDHTASAAAAERVNYLNGGNRTVTAYMMEP